MIVNTNRSAFKWSRREKFNTQLILYRKLNGKKTHSLAYFYHCFFLCNIVLTNGTLSCTVQTAYNTHCDVLHCLKKERNRITINEIYSIYQWKHLIQVEAVTFDNFNLLKVIIFIYERIVLFYQLLESRW